MKSDRGWVSICQSIALWLLPVLFLGIFFFIPMGKIINLSGILQPGLQLAQGEWSALVRPLTFTIFQAVVSTVLTLCIGIPGAYVLSHFYFKGRELIKAALIVPFILPTVVVASCFNSLLGPHGVINELLITLLHLQSPPLALLNSFWAIILGHIFYNTSLVILVVGEAWSKMNPNFEASARVLGTNRFQTALHVTFPLLAPSVLASSLLVFIFDFTSFGVVLLLGGPAFATLEVEIFIQATQMLNLRLATIMSLIQIIMTLGLAAIYARVSRGQSFELTPHFKRGEALNSAPFPQKLFSLGVLTILFIFFFTPLVALVTRSMTSYQPGSSTSIPLFGNASWSYYAELFINRRGSLFYVPPYEAVLNSLLFAAITLLIALPLGVLIVLALRQPHRINRILDPLIMLPLGSSAVTLGLGLLLAFNTTVLYKIPFPVLLPIAHGLVALPLVVRIIQPAIDAIPVNLAFSARVLGADRWHVLRDVELPLLKQPVIVSAIFAFSVSLGEFGATTFLNRPDYPTIPIVIYRFLTQPGQVNYGQAMAMSTILMVICILGIFCIQLTDQTNRERK
ncbi:MAG: iron ABC transporter permease [Anaerolineaceae bacterium]